MKLTKACINIIKWVFIGIILIFTVYPILYTLLGSFKTNWELTSGGSFYQRSGCFQTMHRHIFSLIFFNTVLTVY